MTAIGEQDDDLATYAIQRVSHIRLTQVDDAPGSMLQIQGHHGQVTMLTINAPITIASKA